MLIIAIGKYAETLEIHLQLCIMNVKRSTLRVRRPVRSEVHQHRLYDPDGSLYVFLIVSIEHLFGIVNRISNIRLFF